MSDMKLLLNYKDLMAFGLSRSAVYKIFKDETAPIIQIGRRKFINGAKFMEWLEAQQIKK